MTHCWTCRITLLHPRLYLNSPDAVTISEKPGPRPVCHKCADTFKALDSKGQHILRKAHAADDGRDIPGSAFSPSAQEAMMGRWQNSAS